MYNSLCTRLLLGEDGQALAANRKAMKITVVLCTYNRCRLLPAALESVAASILPVGKEWEVLVVDNNSKDQTRQVVEEFLLRYPGRFQYLFEANPGKSYALNSGIAAAKGDVLAFMDDDVTVAPDWLQNLTVPFEAESYAGTAGRVVPQWNTAAPTWVPKEGWAIAGPLVSFDRGDQGALLEESPVGTNMAFRKSAFEKYGLFRVDLGPSPNSEIRNEDSEFARRLFAAGEHIYYQPYAVVYHPVAEERLTKRYFLTWWFDKGRSQIRESGVPADGKWMIRGIPLYLVRRWLRWFVDWLLKIEERERFDSKLKVWFNAGLIVECSKQAKTRSILGAVRVNRGAVL